MSISIKHISVAIGDEAPSSGFNITIGGVSYHMSGFAMNQSLLSPCTLSLSLHSQPREQVEDTQFAVCGNLIGKKITVDLETENIEASSRNTASDKVAAIKFDGVITGISGDRLETQYFLSVEAHSWDTLLDDSPNCKSYENKTLNEIVNDILDGYPNIKDSSVNARFGDSIPYCVQYNETSLQFLQRIARRYGEWLYHDGTRLVFGQLPGQDRLQLTYPGQDIPGYNVNLHMSHVNFSLLASSYNACDASTKDAPGEMQRDYNDLTRNVFKASQQHYTRHTLQNLHSGGFADSDGRQTVLNVSTKTRARGVKAGMVTYSGTTYSSRLRIGSTLVIKDNYITNSATGAKSPVDNDNKGVLIIGMTHRWDDDNTYSNHFTAIAADCDWPPYTNSDIYPQADCCRATVTDNEDPNNLGRVRVQFDWQKTHGDDMKTPWLRLAQPYAGGEKGFSFIPEVGEEVMIDFEGGNAERPFVKGTLYNGPGNPDGAWLPGSNQVKAIRTRNGHTIEIWDQGAGGYIRIYDHKKENYILTFSTDEKLIKLESTGNIELYARRDIIMHAGHDINASADNDIFIAAKHDMQRTADNDIRERAGHDRNTSIGRNEDLTVAENRFVTVDDNMEEKVKNNLQVTADNIRTEAKAKLMEYSQTHHAKADNDMALNASNKIDIKAAVVKVN